MLRNILLLLVTLSFNSHIEGQSLLEVRDLLSNQVIELNSENINSTTHFEQALQMMTNVFANENISTNDMDRLLAGYNNIIGLSKEDMTIDSVQTVFYDFYLDFSQTFIKAFVDDVFNSTGNKVLFFGTSVSCPCTMKLCIEQMHGVLKTAKEKGTLYLVVDSFIESDLTTKYEIGFYPTVLILNSDNSEAVRYTRDKDFYSKLGKSL